MAESKVELKRNYKDIVATINSSVSIGSGSNGDVIYNYTSDGFSHSFCMVRDLSGIPAGLIPMGGWIAGTNIIKIRFYNSASNALSIPNNATARIVLFS